MAVELILPVSDGLDEDKPQSRYSIERFDYSVVDRGLVDRFIGQETHLSMVGKGVSLGEWVTAKVDDCDPAGSNLSSAGYSIKSIQVTDDGVIGATYLSFFPVGDSITREGGTVAPRSANGSTFAWDQGYYGTASLLHCTGNYFYMENEGWSGENTGGLLARMDALIATYPDADVWGIMSGTNDILGGLTIQESKDNWDAIAAKLMVAGKKLLITPVCYRNRVGEDPVVYNGRADELNAHLILLAATDPNIAIAEVNEEWNVGVMVDQVTWSGLTDDGLHPNGKGGIVLGKETGIALDLYFPSDVDNKVSIIGEEFSGTGGTLSSGATGVVPDGWKGYYTKNSTEDGFAYINRGDGRSWLKCRSNGGAVTNQDNLIRLELLPVDPSDEGWYTAEITFYIEQGADVINKVSIAGQSLDSNFYAADNNSKTPLTAGRYDGQKEYTIKTPSIKKVAGTMEFEFNVAQIMGVDAIVYVAEPKLFKTKDKDWV